MAEAARVCGVSVSTLRRHRDALVAHGATRRDASWAIPITALVAVGLMPRVTPPDASGDAPLTPVVTGADDAPVTALRDALEEATKRAEQAERRAAVAEAIATERERIIDAQRHALRLLEPGPAHEPEQTHSIPEKTPTSPTPSAPNQPRGFFTRLFNR